MINIKIIPTQRVYGKTEYRVKGYDGDKLYDLGYFVDKECAVNAAKELEIKLKEI